MSPTLTLKRRVLLIGAVLLVALFLRGARWLEERQDPLALVPTLDELTYDTWGQAIARGEDAVEVPFTAPLQAYHLAGWHRLFPQNPGRARDAARLITLLLGVATVALTFALGRRASGSFRVGWVAAALVALHRPLIFFEPTLLRDGPGTFVTVLAAWLLLRLLDACQDDERTSTQGALALALGLSLGIGALIRENLVLIGLLLTVALATRSALRSERRRVFALAALLVGLGMLAPLAPWIVSNARIEGAVSLMPTWNGGLVFYNHNRAGNLTSNYKAVPFVKFANAEYEAKGYRREAERRAGHPLTPHQVSRFWLEAGLKDVAASPSLYAKKIGQRLQLFFTSQQVPQARDLRDDASRSWVLRLPSPSGFGFLAAFALLGLLTLPARRVGPRVIAAWVIVLAGTTLPIAFVSRYRLPTVPLVAVLATVTWREWALALRRLSLLASFRGKPPQALLAVALSHRRLTAARAVLGCAALLGGLAFNLRDVPHDPTANQIKRGMGFTVMGRYQDAADELAKPRALSAGGLEALGRTRLELAQPELAKRAYQRSLMQGDDRHAAWAGLALAEYALGNREAALLAIRRAAALSPQNAAYRKLERRLE